MKRLASFAVTFGLVLCPLCYGADPSAAMRSSAHQEYVQSLWKYVQSEQYSQWSRASKPVQIGAGPVAESGAKQFLNADASKSADGKWLPDSVVITEHFAEGADAPSAVTVFRRVEAGYDPENNDWYWAHYLPNGTPVASSADRNPYAKCGFASFLVEGRLWVFDLYSPNLAEFLANGELAKCVTRPAAGPAGITLKAPDSETILSYVAAKPGFVTVLKDGRLWVFSKGSEELTEFQAGGELAKHVTRPAAGPLGMTLKAPDSETILSYIAAKPGFVTVLKDGRLWVFAEDSEELTEFQAGGELAKHVTRPAAGPLGMTLKAPDSETILNYIAAKPGFVTLLKDERLWIFPAASEELAAFKKDGELAKHVTRPGAGPLGMTVKAPDSETIDAYLAASP